MPGGGSEEPGVSLPPMRAKEDETMATAADVDLEVQVSVDVTFSEAEEAER